MWSVPRAHHSKAARSDLTNVLAEDHAGVLGGGGHGGARGERAPAPALLHARGERGGGRRDVGPGAECLRPRPRHGGAVAPRLHGGTRTLGTSRPPRLAPDAARGAARPPRDARGRSALRVDELRAVPNDRAAARWAARHHAAHGHRAPDRLLSRAPRVFSLRGARSRGQFERGDTVASLTP